MPVPLSVPVPPVPVMVTAAVPPLQLILPAIAVAITWVGSVTVTDAVAEQPFASLTVYAYVPALTVYMPVPLNVPEPVPVTIIVVVPPLQAMVPAVAAAVTCAGSVIVTDAVDEH